MSYLSWHYLKCNRFLLRLWANYLAAVWHFFSIGILLRSLLAPWRRVVETKNELGFSLEEFFSRFCFNLISRFIGLGLRFLLISWGLVTLAIFSLAALLIVLLWQFLPIFSLPLYLLWRRSLQPSQKAREKFIEQRLEPGEDRPEDREAVNLWFDRQWRQQKEAAAFWKKERLICGPGLGWSFAFGYTPQLDRYVSDLTLPTPFFHQLVGRQKEIGQIEEILARSGQNNVLLTGEPGVGKRTIVLGLARKVKEGKVRPELAYKRVLLLDMDRIIASLDAAGAKSKLGSLLKEAEAAGNVILVIDNMEKYGEMVEVFLAVIGSEKLQLIGITTPEAYSRYLHVNEKFIKLFEKVEVAAPDKKEALEILMAVLPDFEKAKKARVSFQALKQMIELSDRLVTDIPFPEKAIDLLDQLLAKLGNRDCLITAKDVDELVAQKTKVPVGQLAGQEKEKLKNLESLLASRVIGQDQALKAIASSLRRARLAVAADNKPVGAFLFLGPTGVGKTETAKALSAIYFGSEARLMRFDMGQYQQLDSIDELIGSARTGPGLLVEKVRSSPFSVLLLDELEKANRELLNIFLPIFDEGYLTDYRGKKVSFENLIIIATSNAAAEFIREKVKEDLPQEELQNALLEYVQKEGFLSPEFINRFDAVVVFKPLGRQELAQVAKLQLTQLAGRLKEKEIELTVSPQLIEVVVEGGYSPEFGARPMQRWIADHLEDAIAKELLADRIGRGDKIEMKTVGATLAVTQINNTDAH